MAGKLPHVFILITKGDAGGAQVHVLSLIAQLKDQIRFTLGCGEQGYLTTQANEIGVETVVVPYLQRSISPLTDARCLRALKGILRIQNPDLIHLHSSKAGVIGRLAARSLNIKSLFTAHGWAFTEGSGWKQRSYGLVAEWIMARLGDGIITVSDYDYRLAKRYGVIGDITETSNSWLIPNGVHAIARQTQVTRHERTRLLHIGRLARAKNQHLLIEAVSMISRDFELIIVGDGRLKPGLERLVDQHGLADRVSFIGNTSDVASCLARADIFVLSSDYEGLPLSILEAMSAGLPVVTTDAGGVGEAVSDGLSGFVVKRGDAKGLSEKLTCLIDDEDLRRQFGQCGHRIYCDNFRVEKMCAQTLSVYRTLIDS